MAGSAADADRDQRAERPAAGPATATGGISMMLRHLLQRADQDQAARPAARSSRRASSASVSKP